MVCWFLRVNITAAFAMKYNHAERRGIMSNVSFDLLVHNCEICGKQFEARTEYYVYKVGGKGQKIHWFCSWHCFRENEKRKTKTLHPIAPKISL